ncbi:Zinc knuckle family protein [Senna tora]|uniref:Zinc knuckle family protein n=1 Tax=Senna tora TaxID=362788 RepID=A0A834TF11_9FABA|nr:Zinc knuckle family protein [Senna tora]
MTTISSFENDKDVLKIFDKLHTTTSTVLQIFVNHKVDDAPEEEMVVMVEDERERAHVSIEEEELDMTRCDFPDSDAEQPDLFFEQRDARVEIIEKDVNDWLGRNDAKAQGATIEDFKYKKNEASRITAHCKNNCGWRIHASKTQEGDAFQIKTFYYQHSCGWVRENKKVTVAWLANKYVEYARDQPDWNPTEFANQVLKDHNVVVSRNQTYRAKRKALEKIRDEPTPINPDPTIRFAQTSWVFCLLNVYHQPPPVSTKISDFGCGCVSSNGDDGFPHRGVNGSLGFEWVK